MTFRTLLFVFGGDALGVGPAIRIRVRVRIRGGRNWGAQARITGDKLVRILRCMYALVYSSRV